jgi:hypothetical protein
LPYVTMGLRFLVIAEDSLGTFAMPEVCACSLQLDLHRVGAYVKVQGGSTILHRKAMTDRHMYLRELSICGR